MNIRDGKFTVILAYGRELALNGSDGTSIVSVLKTIRWDSRWLSRLGLETGFDSWIPHGRRKKLTPNSSQAIH